MSRTELAEALHGQEALADLTAGRCPPQAPPPGVGKYLGSSVGAVPAVRMVVCRYGGRDDPRRRGPAAVTDPAAVASWQHRFDALAVVEAGRYHCPNDDGSALLVGFLLDRHGGVLVHVALRGCQFATVGAVAHGTTSAFRNDLLRLVP